MYVKHFGPKRGRGYVTKRQDDTTLLEEVRIKKKPEGRD